MDTSRSRWKHRKDKGRRERGEIRLTCSCLPLSPLVYVPSPYLMSSSSCGRSRTVKLFCPSLSKLVPFVALEDHGLDLGTIARTFGLDPSSLRLNGHFLSRGANLISSVTWNSLLSFFAARGFSTGTSDHDAVVVDGKPCGQDPGWNNPFNNGNAKPGTIEDDGLGIKRKSGLVDSNLLKKRKTEHCKSGCNNSFNSENVNPKTIEDDGHIKRKPGSDDVNLLKKRRMDQFDSGKLFNLSSAVPTINQFACSSISRSLKRPREGELVLTAGPSKKKVDLTFSSNSCIPKHEYVNVNIKT